jgi:hypothetical protein
LLSGSTYNSVLISSGYRELQRVSFSNWKWTACRDDEGRQHINLSLFGEKNNPPHQLKIDRLDKDGGGNGIIKSSSSVVLTEISSSLPHFTSLLRSVHSPLTRRMMWNI